MSDLNGIEKRKLERALGMGSGYVLNFSNRTFAEFFLDNFGIEIYSEKYEVGSGSKANRMRSFWDQESNYLVGRVLDMIFTEWIEFTDFDAPKEPPEDCLRIVRRLQESTPVPDIDAIVPNITDQSFEALSRSVRESIDKNEPEIGLDRLHTFLFKYLRVLCNKRGIEVTKDKPLHSYFGEYIKAIKNEGLIESEMTERILKSSISVFESFNRVRNDQSLAHDNKILNYNESLLIFGYITISIRFINSIEKAKASNQTPSIDSFDELPF